MDRSPISGPPSTAPLAECDQQLDGTRCGLERHCLFNVCVDNACGDGIIAGLEECDDCNERDHDGCSQRCRLEKPPGCGNGVLEPGEECEPRLLGPTCTMSCNIAKCGDNVVQEGEQCDDGNLGAGDGCTPGCQAELSPFVDSGSSTPVVDAGPTGKPDSGPDEVDVGDAGQPATDASLPVDDAATPQLGDAGPAGSGRAQAVAACAACRQEGCTVYQGLFDLVAACFQNPDPQFVQQCVDVMDCAYENGCGYGAAGAPQCFCGSADLGACQTPGTANGPCQTEFFAAGHTQQLSTLIGSFGDVSLPLGVANYFLECDRDLCKACLP